MQKRHIALTLALAATLGASWWAARTPDQATATLPRAAAGRPVAAANPGNRDQLAGDPALTAPPALTPEQYTRAPLAEHPPLQVTLAWGPPPPPPLPPVPKGYKPPPPPPPPLPFRSIGKLEDGTTVTAFLLGPDQSYAVRTGDAINGNYRVEEVTAQHVVLTFLPLNARQELRMDGP